MAVYSQTLTAISIFKYVNIVCIIQVHSPMPTGLARAGRARQRRLGSSNSEPASSSMHLHRLISKVQYPDVVNVVGPYVAQINHARMDLR